MTGSIRDTAVEPLAFEISAPETALVVTTNAAATAPDGDVSAGDVPVEPFVLDPIDENTFADLELPEPPRLTLRDIANESLIIDALLAQAEGELTPELEQRLDQLGELLERKTDGVVAYINGLEDDEGVLKAEEKRLADKRRLLTKRRDRFELFVKNQMTRMDRMKMAGAFSELAVVNNPVKLRILDEKLIPNDYKRTETIPATVVTTVLTDVIKAALQAREEAVAKRDKVIAQAAKKNLPTPTFDDKELPPDVPGATLERETRLRIK